MHVILLAATTGDVTKAGKAIGLALGVGLGALGAGVGIGNIFGFDDPVSGPPARAPRRAAGDPVAGLRTHRGGRVLRPARLDSRLRPGLEKEAG